MGSGGQYIAILPAEDMVIAHNTDLDPNRGAVSPRQWDAILNMVLGASCEDNCPSPQ
jgi:hypothetical protein